MKKINVYISIVALLMLFSIQIKAQQTEKYMIRAEQTQVRRSAGNVIMSMNLDIQNLDLGSQEMVVLTPVIKSSDNVTMYSFAPIVITGSTRDKALKRAMDLGNFAFTQTPQMIVRKKNDLHIIPLTLTMPDREWTNNARLVFEEDVTGCACKDIFNNEYAGLMIPAPFMPQYQLSYITPPVEEVKQRSETYTARINFELAKHKILRNFKNNAEVLDEVDKIINEVRNDANLTITEFHVTGYASPEGNYQFNMTLSKNRAEAFVNYLIENYGISSSSIRTDWKGEDWEGLREVVAGLYNIADKEEILQIIDNESNIDRRKNRIKQLSGGETYRMLLRDYYPPLRRNDYTISYVARAFDINEAKEQIKTKPQHLSLNEMFLVANTYPKDSPEFKETFDIAARMYPNDPIAQVNTAASEIETGNVDTAIQKLQSINTPEAWNNLGIAYFKKNDFSRAKQYFDRAANAGLTIANSNNQQLDKYLSENESANY